MVDAETNNWVSEREFKSISVFATSNLLGEPVFICKTGSQSLVSSFASFLKNVAEKTNFEMLLKFVNIVETLS